VIKLITGFFVPDIPIKIMEYSICEYATRQAVPRFAEIGYEAAPSRIDAGLTKLINATDFNCDEWEINIYSKIMCSG